MQEAQLIHSTGSSSLQDILELVLDKGIVICGDIQIKIADIDLLTIKIRLLVCGVDKAKEMGINWWENDSFLSNRAKEQELAKADKEKMELMKKIEALEAQIKPS